MLLFMFSYIFVSDANFIVRKVVSVGFNICGTNLSSFRLKRFTFKLF